MADTKVRIVDEYGEDVAKNGLEQGEIIVKGNGVMEPIEDSSIINSTSIDGWLYTGDIGTIDKSGRIEIIDRKKDISTSDGSTISSVDVENVFLEHPGVQEVAIISVPHSNQAETLHAFVVLYKGIKVTEKELGDFSKEHLAPSKCPKAITIMDELPKTISGKILKVQLTKIINR